MTGKYIIHGIYFDFMTESLENMTLHSILDPGVRPRYENAGRILEEKA